MALNIFYALQGGGSFNLTLLSFVMMGAVIYFLMIRPQQKQRAELQNLIDSLKSGDKVVTTGGVIGVIKQVNKDSFILQSADKAMIEVTRVAIAGRFQAGEEK